MDIFGLYKRCYFLRIQILRGHELLFNVVDDLGHYFLGSWNSDKQALLQAWPGQSVPNHLGRRHLAALHGQTIGITR